MLGLCHSVYWTVHDLCELIGVPFEEIDLPRRRRQPPGLDAALGTRRRGPLSDGSTSGSPPTRELRRRVRVDMYRRLGYYPTETSEHSAEYVPWYLHHDEEIERLRIPSATTSASARTTSPRTRRAAARRDGLSSSRATRHRVRTAGHPQHGDRHRRGIAANVVNAGLITNLPDGCAVEVPCAGRRLRRAPDARRRPSAAVRGGQPAFLVVDLTVRAAVNGDPRWCGRRWSTRTPPRR